MVAQLRFWGTPVDPDYLGAFKLKPAVSGEEDHPDIDFLRAQSKFEEEAMLIIEDVSFN